MHWRRTVYVCGISIAAPLSAKKALFSILIYPLSRSTLYTSHCVLVQEILMILESWGFPCLLVFMIYRQ